MKPEQALPVKYFIGALFSSEELLEKAFSEVESKFSSIDLKSNNYLFDVTDYYDKEMGIPIYRKIFSVTELLSPAFLPDAKLLSNEIEDILCINGKRKVNLDIGYIDFNKVVLASAKYCANKIYMGKGIYADPAIHYSKGKFKPYPWAFMDFKDSRYYDFIFQIRMKYKSQLKNQ